MFTFDLKFGYHHVEIFPETAQEVFIICVVIFLRTHQIFQFPVLPFGVSSAPYLFTKLLKPLVKK